MRVDAHQHFWDPARASYPWLTDDLAAIRRAFGPGDLAPLLAANGVAHSVLVQTRSSLDETREFLALAARHDFIAGVVGWVDLTAADVAAQIATLRAGPGGAKLVGIRHQVQDEPYATWLLRADVRRGLAAVGQAGLVYDLLVRTRELPAARTVAHELPEVRFVVDHLAKPPIASGALDEWGRNLAPLAALPNVHGKLSGLVTEADWRAWTVEDLVPVVRRPREWFGAERLVFGSDWPVCLLAGSYERVLDAYRRSLGELSTREEALIFGANAVALYRLAVTAPAGGRS